MSAPAPRRPYVSLVLPAYNEALNLERAVAEAAGPLARIHPEWEVILVNDASTDGTGALADQLAADYGSGPHGPFVRVVHHAENKGLGGAVRSGFAAAAGEVVIYTDSDLPFDMDELEAAHARLVETGADLVCGYRANGHPGLKRKLYSAGYGTLVRAALGVRVQDVNFALKVLRREVLDAVTLTTDGSFIDAELLAEAARARFRFAEHGVVYTPRVAGTSTLAHPSVIAGILRDLARYRLGRRARRKATGAPALAR